MLSCAKPKILAYISEAVKLEKLPISDDLTIIRSQNIPENSFEEVYISQAAVDPDRKEALRSLMLEKLDAYLSSHYLEAKLPKAIESSNIVPRSFIESVPKSINVPLTDESNGNGELKNM